MKDEEFERILQEIRLNRQEQQKRLFYQAKREREASGTPKAERADLKSVQCEFESRAEDEDAK
jgi:hypothetical protein